MCFNVRLIYFHRARRGASNWKAWEEFLPVSVKTCARTCIPGTPPPAGRWGCTFFCDRRSPQILRQGYLLKQICISLSVISLRWRRVKVSVHNGEGWEGILFHVFAVSNYILYLDVANLSWLCIYMEKWETYIYILWNLHTIKSVCYLIKC